MWSICGVGKAHEYDFKDNTDCWGSGYFHTMFKTVGFDKYVDNTYNNYLNISCTKHYQYCDYEDIVNRINSWTVNKHSKNKISNERVITFVSNYIYSIYFSHSTSQ